MFWSNHVISNILHLNLPFPPHLPQTNNSVGQSPPDIDKVQSMLTSAAAKIRACLEERHASLAPTSEELKDLSLACGRLWYVGVVSGAMGMVTCGRLLRFI